MGYKTRSNYAQCQKLTQEEFDKIFHKDEELTNDNNKIKTDNNKNDNKHD